MTLLDDRLAEIAEARQFSGDILALERAGHSPLGLFSEECRDGLGCGRMVYKCRDYIHHPDDSIVRVHVYRHADGTIECGRDSRRIDPAKIEE